MGSAFIFVLFELGLLVFLLPITKILRMKKIYEWLKSKIIWNSILRVLIQQYITIYLSTLINIVNFEVNFEFNGTSASSFASIFLFAVCLLLPVANISIILKNKNSLDTKEFQEKYGTLVESIKTK